MKKAFFVLVVAGAAFAIAFFIASDRQAALDATRLAEKQAAWETEKAELQAALRKAGHQTAPVERIVTVEQTKKINPKEIIEKLRAGNFGANPNRRVRLAIQQFENLIELGSSALPAIREFLAQNQDVDYDFAGFGKHSKAPSDLIPASLRFGLFDVVKQIGGEAAKKILADMLRTTGRGIEVAYLARTLQELAPDRYRELALSVARDLLAHPTNADKNERDYLYGVLSMYNDGSLVAQVQNQFIQPDGQIDRAALNYLQKNLGEQTVALAANAYKDSRVDPAKKEPLARVALYFTPINPQATELFNTAINDSGLSVDTRRNLIEDLNQDGISSHKTPTPEDQKLIDARLKLIETYNGVMTDPQLIAAFAEANKDLQHMRAKYAGKSTQ